MLQYCTIRTLLWWFICLCSPANYSIITIGKRKINKNPSSKMWNLKHVQSMRGRSIRNCIKTSESFGLFLFRRLLIFLWFFIPNFQSQFYNQYLSLFMEMELAAWLIHLWTFEPARFLSVSPNINSRPTADVSHMPFYVQTIVTCLFPLLE